MRKFLFLALVACATMQGFAQDENAKIRRSSLYTIKLNVDDPNPEHKEALQIMKDVYEKIPVNVAYNDFRLDVRQVDFEKLPTVTQDEMDVYKKKSGAAKFGNFLKAAASDAAGDIPGVKLSVTPAEEYIARIAKYLEQTNVANNLVAKWHNKKGTPVGSCAWDDNLEVIADYGLVGLTEEDKAAITENGGSITAVAKDCENEVVGNTYVVVNRYSFLKGSELFEELSAPITAQLADANPLVALGLQKTLDVLKKKYATGYFVRCHAYLYQLDNYDWVSFYEKYDKNEGAFANADYHLTYLGKSEGRARARKADDGNVLGLAMERATDKCYADLQHDFEQFRPFYMLHEINGTLGAYIGTKEGVTAKTAFDVYENKLVIDKKTNTQKMDLKKVGSLKVEKNGVWENRVGEGDEGEDEEGEEKGDTSRTYTLFKGKPSGKLMEGAMIRIAK